MQKILYLFVLAVSITACQNDKRTSDTSTEKTAVQTVPKETSLRETLQNTTPRTSEALQKSFPQRLYNLKLDKEPVINGQTISGHFGGRKITLGITDAAGKQYRSATYFLDALNDDHFVDTDDTKFIKKERNGIKTFTKHYVESHTELEFLYKNRFYIHLLSEMNPDELWEAFDLKTLEKF